jgi:hypothetical protein
MKLPTLDAVREELGEPLAPQMTYAVAALTLQVDGVRREAWSDKTELAVPLFESYPRGRVPPADIAAGVRSHKIIDDAAKTEARRCSTCVIRPGFQPCAVCVGTGAGSGRELPNICYACSGEGFVKCSVCDGTMRVVACSVRYVNDTPVRVRRAIVPAVDASIRPFLEAKINAEALWPPDHVFDPEPGLVASAYRGASAVRAQDESNGFFFGEAIAVCLEARSEVTTGLAAFTVRTFAVPILWTITDDRHEAFFYDEKGELQTVRG